MSEHLEAKVLNLWWEGTALHIVTEKAHTVYEGAYVTSQDFSTHQVERIVVDITCPISQVKILDPGR